MKKPATTEWEFLTLNPKGVDADWCRFTRLTVGMCNFKPGVVVKTFTYNLYMDNQRDKIDS